MSVRSVSPESQFGGNDDSDDQQDYREETPRQKAYPKPPAKSLSYHECSSSNGDTESTRMFSGSSTGTSASSNENWQTFGDESDEEESVAGGHDRGYYGRGHDGYSSKRVGGGGGGVIMVRNEDEVEEWEGEATRRY